jgi:hypothetical protein
LPRNIVDREYFSHRNPSRVRIEVAPAGD